MDKSRHFGGRPIPVAVRSKTVAARLLELWVRIPPGGWMSLSCDYYLLSGKGLWIGLRTHPEESYGVKCVWGWSWSLDNKDALADLRQLRREKRNWLGETIRLLAAKVCELPCSVCVSRGETLFLIRTDFTANSDLLFTLIFPSVTFCTSSHTKHASSHSEYWISFI